MGVAVKVTTTPLSLSVMRIRIVSSHSLSLFALLASVVMTVFVGYIILPIIVRLISGDSKYQDILALIFYTIFSFYVSRNYFIAFTNSVVSYSESKVKVSPLFCESKLLSMSDLISVHVKYQLGGEYAIITYKFNNRVAKAYTFQNPLDHVTSKTIGVQGLLESSSDWNNIYYLKKIVEKMNDSQTPHPSQ